MRACFLHFFRVLALALGLCGVMAAHAQTAPAPTPTPSAPSTSSTSGTATPLASALDAETFYYLLLGELSAIGGEAPTAYALFLDAARKSNSEQLYQRATEIALRARSGELALQAAQSWRTAQPKSLDANRMVLEILLALNKVPESAEPLKAVLALSKSGELAPAVQQVPRYYARASDRKAATTAVELALADYTKAGPAAAPAVGAEAWVAVGRMRLASNDSAGALDAARKANTLQESNIGPAFLALEMMDAKTPGAEELVRKYLGAANASTDVRLGYARELINAQRYPDATAQLRQLTTGEPALADPWLLLGSIQVQDNQLDSGEASLKKYIELAQSPQRAMGAQERRRGLDQAFLTMAQVFEKRKDFKSAEAWLGRVENADELLAVRTRRASILVKQGQVEQARAQITSMPARNAAEERAKLMAEVALLREAKLNDSAYQLLERAIAKDPADADLLYDQALLAEKLQRMAEMERLLRQYISAKPESPNGYNALGYSLADRNIRLDEAKKLIQKALELSPGDPFITDSLGWVEFRMGNKQEALRILEGAYRSRPDPEIGAHLGEVLWSMGQRDKALTIWREAQLLGSENETLQETIKRLRVRL
jgi:tetratricopeptide (TPR) repeat protein